MINKLKILIIEDSSTFSEYLHSVVISENYEGICAFKGKEAFDILQNNVFNLVLLDMELPDFSGIEILKFIRKTFNQIELPVIFISSVTDDNKIIQALEIGANDFISKPFKVIELKTKIKNLLQLQQSIENRKIVEQELILAKSNLEKTNKELVRQKEEIELHYSRLEGLVRISQYQTNSIQELLDYTLSEVIQLTKSKIGYIYFYDEAKKQFILNSWSKNVMDECMVVNPQSLYDLDRTGCWGEAVRQGKPFIINDFEAFHPKKKGTPEGHVKLLKFLTIPVFFEEKIVAVVGVANKDTDYDNTDVLQITLLMDKIWRILERIELINTLNETNEQLDTQVELLKVSNATKDKFFSILAHDLRSPFNALIGFSDLLVENALTFTPDKVEQIAKNIYKTSLQTFSLLENLLEWSMLQTGKIKPNLIKIKASELIKDVILLIEHMSSSKNIELRYINSKDDYILVDKEMIKTVLRNLLTNAIKYTPEKGKIIVSTNRENSKLKISISDSGVGINQVDIEKLFQIENMVTTIGTNKEKGTGLGLILCKEFIEKHEGEIYVESKIGNGSTFSFTVPLFV